MVSGAKRSAYADWSARGVAQVQDPTAAAVVAQVQAQAGQVVLDRCCGLGTKTLQMREAIGESGRIVAIDPAESRCQGLRRLLEQRHIQNVAVYCASRLQDLPDLSAERFDRALLDVPCSNSGVLARRPEARYSQNTRALQSLAKLQDTILHDTAGFIKPTGLLVYSTCSVWAEENEERIGVFLRQHPDFELMESQNTLPNLESDPLLYHDGGFVAVFRRI